MKYGDPPAGPSLRTRLVLVGLGIICATISVIGAIQDGRPFFIGASLIFIISLIGAFISLFRETKGN